MIFLSGYVGVHEVLIVKGFFCIDNMTISAIENLC